MKNKELILQECNRFDPKFLGLLGGKLADIDIGKNIWTIEFNISKYYCHSVDVVQQQMLITGEGDELVFSAGNNGAKLLLMKGKPFRESVAHYGPFVMNTKEEIDRTLQDYQSGKFLTL